MELEEFISKTLVSIAKGIKSANKDMGQSFFTIEPISYQKNRTDGCIEFDVAVTASKGTGSKVGGEIKIWPVGLGGKKETNISDQTVSRIKFSVAPEVKIG
mgnify:FL=1